LIIFLLLRGNNVAGVLDAERNLVYSNEGTYGTAGWMTKKELHAELEVTGDLKCCRGTILGELNGKAVCVPEKTFMNRNVAVYGAAGSMKSRAYVRNMCYQLVCREESIIFTDPKGELFSDMAEYLKAHGYIVRVFNLKTPENSDPWDCLGEIEGSELFAQMFSDVIIKNTINGKGDHFWDNSEMCLLKALCLYVEYGDSYPSEKKNIGEVYKLLTMASGTELYTMFDKLPPSHPAKAPFAIFQQASDNVRGGIIIGLASRIQVFQNSMICDITKGYYNADGSKKVDENGYDIGIDLVLPGKEKCAYFCIISDQDSTFTFLSSLFLSLLFINTNSQSKRN